MSSFASHEQEKHGKQAAHGDEIDFGNLRIKLGFDIAWAVAPLPISAETFRMKEAVENSPRFTGTSATRRARHWDVQWTVGELNSCNDGGFIAEKPPSDDFYK